MKTTILLAAAIALSFASGAEAKNKASGAHAQKNYKTKSVRAVRRPVMPAPSRDPYAKYWDDPGRAAPPFSYRRGDTH